MFKRSRRVASTRRNRRAAFFNPFAETLESRTLLTSPGSLNLVIAPGVINEGGTANLTGTFTDTDPNNEVHTIVINWGDGDTSTVSVPAGGRDFATNHVYSLPANGQPSASYSVSAQLNDSTGHSAENVNTPTILVNNVAPTVAITGAPISNPVEATPINLGSAITDPGGAANTFTYDWQVTRGSGVNPPTVATGNGPSLNFTPSDNGIYTVALTVTDANGAPTTAIQVITVDDAPPATSITGAPTNLTSPEGTTINLAGTAIDPSADDTDAGLQFAWTVLKDGNSVPVATGSSNTFSFQPNDNGLYQIFFAATDKDGLTGTSAVTINVTDVAPTAAIHGDSSPTVPVPTTGLEGTAISLNATATDPSLADVAAGFTFSWRVVSNNGDAFNGAGANFAFTPTDNGTYTVSLTATDKDGLSNTTSATIAVANAAPDVTVMGAPVNLTSPEMTKINLSSSITDPGTDDFSYHWHLVTTNSQQWRQNEPFDSTDSTFSFTPNDNGIYTVTLTVLDDDGGARTVTKVINVTNVAPTPEILNAPATGTAGTPITLNATATDISPIDSAYNPPNPFAYSWQVTLGTNPAVIASGAGNTFTFTPNTTGQYHVKLTAADKDGSPTNVDVVDIAVGVSAPSVQIFGTNPVNEGTAVSLVAVATSPAQNAVFSYSWAINDVAVAGATSQGLSFTPTDNGVYKVTVTVKDTANPSANDTSTATFFLNVDNVAPIPAIHGGTNPNAAPPTTGKEGTEIELNATAIDPSSVDSANGFDYAWTVTRGTGSNPPVVAQGTGVSFKFTPSDGAAGGTLYTVILTATDRSIDAKSSTVTLPIQVANVAPNVSFNPSSLPLTGTGTEGTPITLVGIVSDVQAGTTGPKDIDAGLHFTWTVAASNGQVIQSISGNTADPAPPLSFTFTPNDSGVYTVNLTATDKDGASNSVSRVYTVGEAALLPTFSGIPSSAKEGAPITLVGNPNDPGTNDTYSYQWTIRKGSAANSPVYTTGTGQSFTFAPNDNGPYRAELVVTDGDNTSGSFFRNFAVGNVEPTPIIHGATVLTQVPSSVNQGTPINLTSTVTDPSSIDTTVGFTYFWHVIAPGNNQPTIPDSTASTFSFTPQAAGTYTVSLSVTDKNGETGTATSVIQVLNVVPTVSITNAPSSSPEGTELVLGAVVTDPGVQAGVENPGYLWKVTSTNGQFGQLPSQTLLSTDPTLKFKPSDNGIYTVSLTVIDGSGGSVSDTKTIVVINATPEPIILGAPVNLTSPEGTTIFLVGNPNDPGTSASPVEDPTTAQTWSVSKSHNNATPTVYATGTGAGFFFTPDDDGNYVVTYTVTDKDGATASTTKTIVVTNVAPTPAIHAGTDPNAAPPTSGTEGVAIVMNATATDPSSADRNAFPTPLPAHPFSFAWKITKGTGANPPVVFTATGATVSFTPTDNDVYTISLTATDKDLLTSLPVTRTITVGNAAPQASFTNGGSVDEGTTGVVFFYNVTDAANDLSSLKYSYDFNNDGDFTDAGDLLNVPNAAVSIPAALTADGPKSFTVHGRITDKDGASTDYTSVVQVNNLVPVPVIHGATTVSPAPTSGVAGVEIALTATATDANPTDTPFAYSWKVTQGGGANPPVVFSGTGATFKFTPASQDSYTVTLTAVDKDGGSGSTSLNINVGSIFPSALFLNGGPVNIGSPANVFFANQTGGGPLPNGPYTYSYDFNNDGDFTDTGELADSSNSAVQVPASYTTLPGTITVRGRISDASTPTPHFTDYTTTITINAVSPTATIYGNPQLTQPAPSQSGEGTPITLYAKATSPSPAFTSFTFNWTVTKGTGTNPPVFTTGTGSQFTFTPDDNATYKVTLAASDGVPNNPPGTTSTTINVSNVAPTVSILGSTNGQEGTPLSFTSTVSDPSTADQGSGLSYTWHVDTGSTGQPQSIPYIADGHGTTFNFTPLQDGVYTLTLTVADKDGLSTVDTKLITVTDVAPTLAVVPNNGSIVANSPYTVNLNNSDPGYDPVDHWVVNWGDATAPQTIAGQAVLPINQWKPVNQSVQATHAFLLAGSYTITATAFNIDGSFVTTASVLVVSPTASGPRVVSSTPSGDVADPISNVRLTFDKPIDASSFTLSQLSLTGPNGSVPLSAVNGSSITQLADNQFNVSFPIQSALGDYSLLVGPGIRDTSGNLMNQDSDAANGENPDDRYTAAFSRVPATVGNFDFGTPTSPVGSGFSQVTPATLYSPALGYGWSSATGVYSMNRGGDPVVGDFIYTRDGTFLADVVNGTYSVTLTLGDALYMHDRQAVSLNGVQVDSVNTAAGQLVTKTYSITITNGQLAVRIQDLGGGDPNACLESLTIGADTSGPRVILSTPLGQEFKPLDHFDLTFDKPIQASSLTPAQLSLTGPGGAITPLSVARLSASVFRVSFATQTALGTYNLKVGPNVLDLAGNPMNQDGDSFNGEANDGFTASVTQTAPGFNFDFGTLSSPVASGYSKVTATTAYTPSLGYGWIAGTRADLDRGGADALTGDFVYTQDSTFRTDLPNGFYQVTVSLGDLQYAHDLQQVYLNGVLYDTVNTAFGQVVTKTYSVEVTNGQILLQVKDNGGGDPNACLAGFTIGADKAGPSVVASSPSNTQSGALGHFDLTFSEPIDASTLTVSQLTLTGPGNVNIPLTAANTTILQISATVFQVWIPAQTALGTYSLKVGPNVTDLSGNTMNQNGNAINGEASDAYTASVTLQAVPQQFDFGVASSPLSGGYTRVTEATTYSAAQGYGWTAGTINSMDRTNGGTDLTRDFNYTTDGTFQVDLANGTYQVTVTLGDMAYMHDWQQVILNGVTQPYVHTAAGQVVSNTYTVTVTNGKLVLQLRDNGGGDPYACIAGLAIS